MDRKIEKKKWTVKNIAIYSLSTLFAIFVIYTILFGDNSSKLNVESEKITISTVAKDQFQEFIPVTGTAVPIKTVYLDAIEGGRVEEKVVEEGTFIKEGDVLLRFSNTNLYLDVMFREAQVFEQINNLRNTRLAMENSRLQLQGQLIEFNYQIKQQKRSYKRAKDLVEKELISPEEYEQIRDEYQYLVQRKNLTVESHKQDSIFRNVQIKQLEESVERMNANLEVVKQKLASLEIKAPTSGHLTSLNAEIGESKSAGERLGQIDILDGFKVRVGVDEHYIARINKGQSGEFDFAGKNYKLVIKKIYPEVVNGRFEVDMEFVDSEPENIRRGQTLHIRLALGDLSEAVLLARGGFYQKTGGQWVYVLDESSGMASKRSIKLGRMNPQYFEVLSGLEPGEKVITSSYDNFGDNDKLVLK